jgi:hypothetical protein
MGVIGSNKRIKSLDSKFSIFLNKTKGVLFLKYNRKNIILEHNIKARIHFHKKAKKIAKKPSGKK